MSLWLVTHVLCVGNNQPVVFCSPGPSPLRARPPALWGRAEVTVAASLCYFGNRDDWGALCNGIEFLAGGKETLCECDSLIWLLLQDPFSVVA